MKILLPVETEPLFVSRFESAVYFSVIQAQAKKYNRDITPWLACQLANYHHSKSFLWQFDTIKDMNWYAGKKLFFKQEYLSDVRMPGWNEADVAEIITEALKSGKYVHVKADAFYLPEDAGYNTLHRDTDCLVYGYDNEEETLYYLRHKPSLPLSFNKCSLSNMIDAACKRKCGTVSLNLLIYNSDFIFSSDHNDLYNSLYDFLHSTRQFPPVSRGFEIYYGLKSFQCLRNYICDVGLNYEHIDRKYYSSFYDFQIATLIRHRYFRETGIINPDSGDEETSLSGLSQNFLSACMAYNEKGEAKYLKEAIDCFDEIVSIDTVITVRLLKALDNLSN